MAGDDMSPPSAPWRRRVLPLVILIVTIVSIAGVWLEISRDRPDSREAPLRLTAVAFTQVPGWDADALIEALPAWLRSCEVLLARDAARPMGGSHPVFGITGDWQAPCAELLTLPQQPTAFRTFLETRFVALAARAGHEADGLFTGYYEPELTGALDPSARFATPIRGLPDDLVQVDLGLFREDLRGERMAGRVQDGRLVPYAQRSDIERGGLADQERVLAWVDDPVDAFFLHIQGSGRIRLPDGGVLRVGYAGQNGHPYTAIGRVLIEAGALTREEVTMESIRDWLTAHPAQAEAVMHANASYIFFQILEGDDPTLGPLGAQGVSLTPHRSLAVDDAHYPYGVPVWLDTEIPVDADPEETRAFRRLMIAQDTGGAIRGAVRGDIYVGSGPQAGRIAGAQKHAGRLHVLVPRPLAVAAGLIAGEAD